MPIIGVGSNPNPTAVPNTITTTTTTTTTVNVTSLVTDPATATNQIATNGLLAVIAKYLSYLNVSGTGVAPAPPTTHVQQVSQPVSNAAYSTGQAVGGLMTFNAAARLPTSSGTVQSLVISLPDAQAPTLDVLVFSAPPTSSTINNRAAVSISLADQAKQIGVIHISDCTSYLTPTICQSQQVPLPFALAANLTSLYCVIVARNSFTPANLPVSAPAWTVTLYTQQN